LLAQKVAIEDVVGVAEERGRATVAALGDVVRMIGDDDARKTGHAILMARFGSNVNKCTVTVIAIIA
jgi:hypothetical protein